MTDSSLFDADASSLVEVDDALLDAVTSHWSDTLSLDKRCDEITRSLGLTRGLAVQFNVGLSDRSLGLRIPSRQLKAGRILRERLETLGIFRSSGHEAFRGCLVVPVREGARSWRSSRAAWTVPPTCSGRTVCPVGSLNTLLHRTVSRVDL